ncbi:MAG TPA: winged helix-turn-helix transcriptional regulator [Nitrososphaerales archaeon]|nr:winged helix-turn-helix transcriptional regulator [Nitrososphaerales archaeon]
MNASATDGARRLDAPPWEPYDRFLDGRWGVADSRTAGGMLTRQASAYGAHSSTANAELKSGLTRRGVIYQYVRAHPGTHVRGMGRGLRLATGDLYYHLFWLEKHGFVKTKKNGFYRYVFPTMVFREGQEVLLGVLSQETPRELLLTLMLDAAMTQGGLARSLGHSQPTISWHLDRLIQLGVVGKRMTNGRVVYEIAADRDDVLRFVKSYHPEVWKRWAGRLADLAVSGRVKRVVEGGSLQEVRPMPPAVVELIGKR